MRSLRLWEAPEFQPTEYPKGWTWQLVEARIGEIWRGIWERPSGPEDSSREHPIESTRPSDVNPPTQAQIDATVGAYAGYLTTGNDGHSMTIRVSYRALTPERAATVVNAQIDSYRNLEVKAKVRQLSTPTPRLTPRWPSCDSSCKPPRRQLPVIGKSTISPGPPRTPEVCRRSSLG